MIWRKISLKSPSAGIGWGSAHDGLLQGVDEFTAFGRGIEWLGSARRKGDDSRTIAYPIRRNWSISIKYPPPAQTELVLRDGFRQS